MSETNPNTVGVATPSESIANGDGDYFFIPVGGATPPDPESIVSGAIASKDNSFITFPVGGVRTPPDPAGIVSGNFVREDSFFIPVGGATTPGPESIVSGAIASEDDFSFTLPVSDEPNESSCSAAYSKAASDIWAKLDAEEAREKRVRDLEVAGALFSGRERELINSLKKTEIELKAALAREEKLKKELEAVKVECERLNKTASGGNNLKFRSLLGARSSQREKEIAG
jgi:hypothetical protein